MTDQSPAYQPCDHGSSYGNGDGTRTCVTCADVFPARPEDAVPWDTDQAASTASQPPEEGSR